MQRRQSPETRFNDFVFGVVGDTEEGVEVARGAQPVIGFVNGVEEVGKDDGDVDAPAMFDVEGRTGLGFGVAGADYNAVVECLKPSGNKLLGIRECGGSRTEHSRLAKRSSRRRRGGR